MKFVCYLLCVCLCIILLFAINFTVGFCLFGWVLNYLFLCYVFFVVSFDVCYVLIAFCVACWIFV